MNLTRCFAFDEPNHPPHPPAQCASVVVLAAPPARPSTASCVRAPTCAPRWTSSGEDGLKNYQHAQPPTVVCKMGAQSEYVRDACARFFLHVPRRYVNGMLSRCLIMKALHRSSAVGSLPRVRCWLGLLGVHLSTSYRTTVCYCTVLYRPAPE